MTILPEHSGSSTAMSDSSDSSLSSFVDDGVDIEQCMLSRLDRHPSTAVSILQWIDDSSSEVTGSFCDDGEDLLLVTEGAATGFGDDDPLFYHDPAPKRPDVDYHPSVKKAIEGQVNNILTAQRAISKFSIGDPGPERGRATKQEREETGRKNGKAQKGNLPVKVFVPARVPDFVIHGEDGHLLVVDSDNGVIDSRPPPVLITLTGKPTRGALPKGDEKEKPRYHQAQKRKEKARKIHGEDWAVSGGNAGNTNGQVAAASVWD